MSGLLLTRWARVIFPFPLFLPVLAIHHRRVITAKPKLDNSSVSSAIIHPRTRVRGGRASLLWAAFRVVPTLGLLQACAWLGPRTGLRVPDLVGGMETASSGHQMW